MTIIIIDSGIPADYKSPNNIIESKGVTYSVCSDEFYMTDTGIDMIGHGTAVLDIIDRHVNHATIISIKIFNDQKEEAEGGALLFALEYIYKHIECEIINISNGITAYDAINDLFDICLKLKNKGTIIVSAFDNLGGISFPAAFDSVIGVDYSTEVEFGNYLFVKNGIVNVKFGLAEQRVLWLNYTKKIVVGNSFLAPYVTSMLADYICMNPLANFQNILKFLENNAEHIIKYRKYETEESIFPIKKAVTFPYNKEIDCILRNCDMLNFQIVHTYDSKYMRNIGKKVTKSCVLENIENVNWTDDFDTFILGHSDILEQRTGIEYAKNIINLCMKYNKNIYSLDKSNLKSFSIYEIKEKTNLFFPNNKKIIMNSAFMENKLYTNNVPVIGVLGTSSKQGKLTLQLQLRKFFENKGYKVGQLGTEPTSLLFGFDEMFVMGYNSEINQTSQSNIPAINRLMHRVSIKQPDIIIVGSQSHTIPLGYNSMDSLPVFQQDLLLGTLPDACLLCINYDDDISYIKRTVQYIESLCETKVIALYLSDLNKNSKWTQYGLGEKPEQSTFHKKDFINILIREIKIPVYCNNELNKLLNCVLEFFLP